MKDLLKKISRAHFLFASIGLLIALLLVDIIAGESKLSHGIIEDKIFTPERNYTTVNMVAHHSGKSTYYTTEIRHHYDPPHWDFVVKCRDGSNLYVSATSAIFYQKPVGSIIDYQSRFGYLTGWRYWSNALKSSNVTDF